MYLSAVSNGTCRPPYQWMDGIVAHSLPISFWQHELFEKQVHLPKLKRQQSGLLEKYYEQVTIEMLNYLQCMKLC